MKIVRLTEEELERLKMEVEYLLRRNEREVRELEGRRDQSTDEFLVHARQFSAMFKRILKKVNSARDA